ncbi:hypothetical protein [Inmirania thermothiophila]|uniref:Uncharacterized protein n=1 Tax=Inmirania thermothiophila TaxID=1750597 RepID=A0A3N1XSM2_9GAMM|nr:hypothetical protein [Inmirania thermothiophila]ROR29643.1 hypothetical protein EDC57_2314 [Inmirania thermothiophila]
MRETRPAAERFVGVVAGVFVAVNGAILYLFLLQFPFGLTPFLASLRHWDRLTPRIFVAAALAAALAVVARLAVSALPERWKDRLTYWRGGEAHPARDVFFTTRRQPFDGAEAVRAFPEVKEAAFAPARQLAVWRRLEAERAAHPIVAGTRAYWLLVRDLHLLSLAVLLAFLVSWPINGALPFAVAAPYLFVFGTQYLFLLLTARRAGHRYADTVLAIALGIEPGGGGRR